jgi:hypothetical protein
VGFRIPWLKKR